MKHFIIVILCMVYHGIKSQNGAKTFTLLVKGNCGQCKERIENAADIKGVKLTTWDEHSQIAKITFNPEKVNEKQIEEAICKSGHDVGAKKADSKDYEKLPDCCKYRERKHNETSKH